MTRSPHSFALQIPFSHRVHGSESTSPAPSLWWMLILIVPTDPAATGGCGFPGAGKNCSISFGSVWLLLPAAPHSVSPHAIFWSLFRVLANPLFLPLRIRSCGVTAFMKTLPPPPGGGVKDAV